MAKKLLVSQFADFSARPIGILFPSGTLDSLEDAPDRRPPRRESRCIHKCTHRQVVRLAEVVRTQNDGGGAADIFGRQ